MPKLSLFEVLYPFILFLTAGGFWSVINVRPDMASARWFALSFLFGGLAFGVEFFRFGIPVHFQALLGAGFYMSMAACFVFGLISRADKLAPIRAITAISTLSVLAVWGFSLLDVSVIVRVGVAQFSSGLLLSIGLFCSRTRFATFTDKTVFLITAGIACVLFAQPVIVGFMVGLSSKHAEYDTSMLYIRMGVITTLSSIGSATFLVREYFMLIIEELRVNANRDKLTGLLNRRGFEDTVDGMIAKADAGKGEIAVIMLDIDRFKELNDSYGHGLGDEVLRALGMLLNTHKGPEGLAVRMGGEEFLLLLPVTELEQGLTQTRLLRERWARQRFYGLCEEIISTASFGVSLYQKGEPISAAISRADKALYHAKQTGRNRVISEFDLRTDALKSVAAKMGKLQDRTLSPVSPEHEVPATLT